MNSNIGLNRNATGDVARRAFMARTTLSKLIQCALLSSALVAGSASAALFDVVVTTGIPSGDFVSGIDTVFGVAPADLTFGVTLRVDTTAGPPDTAAAGDPNGALVFAHDVFATTSSRPAQPSARKPGTARISSHLFLATASLIRNCSSMKNW